MVVLGRKLLKTIVELVHMALGLPCTSNQEDTKTLMVTKEVLKKGVMQQIKDIADPYRKAQSILYLQNLPFMAKAKDMSSKITAH